MKAVYVEPGKKAVIREVAPDLDSLQAAVGGNIEAVYPFRDAACIICNEDAKLEGQQLNRALYASGEIVDIIAGPFLIVGMGDEDFESLTDSQAEEYRHSYLEPETFIRFGNRILAVHD